MKEFIKAYSISFLILSTVSALHKVAYNKSIYSDWYCIPMIVSVVSVTIIILNRLDKK